MRNNEHGMITVALLIFVLAIVTYGIAITTATFGQYQRSTQLVAETNALQVAEAGIERSLVEINQDDMFTGFTNEEFFDNATQGYGVYTTTITDISGSDAKEITSIGEVYRRASDVGVRDPLSERRIRVTIVGTISGGYGLFSGPGGLLLSGDATILNTDVFINGTLDMSGNAQIGAETEDQEVNVAHISCPLGADPGPTYPTQCTTSAGEPITMNNNAVIYGTVCATNQTTSTGIEAGTGGGLGLKLGCTAPSTTTPVYERSTVTPVDSPATTSNDSNNAHFCKTGSSKDRTWPADIKFTGDVTVTNKCDITVSGDVHITGDLSIGGQMQLITADSALAERPIIFVDGTIDIGGSVQIVPNASGTSIHLVANEALASCDPACELSSDVVGTDLYNSQQNLTVSVSGNVNIPGTILQANWGLARIRGVGEAGAVIGQTVDLGGTGSVIFGESLNSGTKTWSISSYQRLPNN